VKSGKCFLEHHHLLLLNTFVYAFIKIECMFRLLIQLDDRTECN